MWTFFPSQPNYCTSSKLGKSQAQWHFFLENVITKQVVCRGKKYSTCVCPQIWQSADWAHILVPGLVQPPDRHPGAPALRHGLCSSLCGYQPDHVGNVGLLMITERRSLSEKLYFRHCLKVPISVAIFVQTEQLRENCSVLGQALESRGVPGSRYSTSSHLACVWLVSGKVLELGGQRKGNTFLRWCS